MKRELNKSQLQVLNAIKTTEAIYNAKLINVCSEVERKNLKLELEQKRNEIVKNYKNKNLETNIVL